LTWNPAAQQSHALHLETEPSYTVFSTLAVKVKTQLNSYPMFSSWDSIAQLSNAEYPTSSVMINCTVHSYLTLKGSVQVLMEA
jgi:hypothetical protein